MVKNKTTMDLPDECWELIFKKLGHHYHLDAISLVCKRFLSISSCLLNSLTISDSTILLHCNFSKLSQRFRQIKRIHVSSTFKEFNKELEDLIFEIAQSGFNIEELCLWDQYKTPLKCYQQICSNMKDLKTLKCENSNLRDSGLIVIGYSLPKLQQLRICTKDIIAISDKGVEEFASKHKELRKINLTIYGYGDDAYASRSVTARGITHSLRHCSNFTSLSVTYRSVNFCTSPSTFAAIENSLSFTRALCALEFENSVISDALLASMVNANLPLKKLKFIACRKIRVSGLSILLQKYQSLNNFELLWSRKLTDKDMDHLSKYLRHVNRINLSGCVELTNSTFFLLARSCPLLVDIIMLDTGIGKEGDLRVDLKKHGHIQFLDLSWSIYLNDESLKRIGYICPNLQMLELTGQRHITEEGISDIMKSCRGLRHFIFTKSNLDTIFETNSEQSKLNIEVLLVGDMINDKGMATIGMRCPRLLKLNIMYCSKVTAEGVKEVVEKCPKLMELDLSYCRKVDFDALSSMLLTRPSLRKVFSPDKYYPTEEEKNLFMSHGCRLCTSAGSISEKKASGRLTRDVMKLQLRTARN